MDSGTPTEQLLLEKGGMDFEDSLETADRDTEQISFKRNAGAHSIAQVLHWISHGVSIATILVILLFTQQRAKQSGMACTHKHDSWCS